MPPQLLVALGLHATATGALRLRLRGGVPGRLRGLIAQRGVSG